MSPWRANVVSSAAALLFLACGGDDTSEPAGPTPTPTPQAEATCGDTLDNDRDGLTDCDDPDCLMRDACMSEPPREICDNGRDDDGDTLADCDDSDCQDRAACRTSSPMVAVADDDVTLTEDREIAVDVLGNDTLPDKEAARVVITEAPTLGQVWVRGSDRHIVYVPQRDAQGEDAFRYGVDDADGERLGEALVSVRIEEVNDAPRVMSKVIVIPSVYREGSALSVELGAIDPDGDALTVRVERRPDSGQVTYDEDRGVLIYTGRVLEQAALEEVPVQVSDGTTSSTMQLWLVHTTLTWRADGGRTNRLDDADNWVEQRAMRESDFIYIPSAAAPIVTPTSMADVELVGVALGADVILNLGRSSLVVNRAVLGGRIEARAVQWGGASEETALVTARITSDQLTTTARLELVGDTRATGILTLVGGGSLVMGPHTGEFRGIEAMLFPAPGGLYMSDPRGWLRLGDRGLRVSAGRSPDGLLGSRLAAGRIDLGGDLIVEPPRNGCEQCGAQALQTRGAAVAFASGAKAELSLLEGNRIRALSVREGATVSVTSEARLDQVSLAGTLEVAPGVDLVVDRLRVLAGGLLKSEGLARIMEALMAERDDALEGNVERP